MVKKAPRFKRGPAAWEGMQICVEKRSPGQAGRKPVSKEGELLVPRKGEDASSFEAIGRSTVSLTSSYMFNRG